MTNSIPQKIAYSLDPQDLQKYGKDWSMNFPADPSLVLFPENEEQVQEIVRWAIAEKRSLVPSGGRTGLSSAATASQKEVVVSFDRMNKILDFNEVDQIVRVEPGVILEDLIDFVASKGYFFPVDLAAKGSSQIGGNTATNAGGLRVLKYGMMRNWVYGLRVVTGEGTSLALNRSLVKNATGYDLKNLWIGSEGTLGFITEIELKFTQAPKGTSVLVLGLQRLADVISVYALFKKSTPLSACEVFSDFALNKVMEMHGLPRPFESEANYYLLLEVENQSEESDSEALASLFEQCFEQGWIHDGVISQSPQQARTLWHLREFISEAISPMSPYRNDVSVRTSRIPQFVVELEAAYKNEYPDFQVAWFGHIGDGNLHVDILKPDQMNRDEFIKKCKKSDQTLFSIVQKFEGSISAEHGVGLLKKDYLSYTRSIDEIELMKKIKTIFDPYGIINPGKIFDIKTQ